MGLINFEYFDKRVGLKCMIDRNGETINIGDSFIYQPYFSEILGHVYEKNGIVMIKWEDNIMPAQPLRAFYYNPYISDNLLKCNV